MYVETQNNFCQLHTIMLSQFFMDDVHQPKKSYLYKQVLNIDIKSCLNGEKTWKSNLNMASFWIALE